MGSCIHTYSALYPAAFFYLSLCTIVMLTLRILVHVNPFLPLSFNSTHNRLKYIQSLHMVCISLYQCMICKLFCMT